jgi:hypothetical protein
MLFKEVIAVYSEHHTKPPCVQKGELINATVCGTYSYHCAWKDLVKYLETNSNHNRIIIVTMYPNE